LINGRATLITACAEIGHRPVVMTTNRSCSSPTHLRSWRCSTTPPCRSHAV